MNVRWDNNVKFVESQFQDVRNNHVTIDWLHCNAILSHSLPPLIDIPLRSIRIIIHSSRHNNHQPPDRYPDVDVVSCLPVNRFEGLKQRFANYIHKFLAMPIPL